MNRHELETIVRGLYKLSNIEYDTHKHSARYATAKACSDLKMFVTMDNTNAFFSGKVGDIKKIMKYIRYELILKKYSKIGIYLP